MALDLILSIGLNVGNSEPQGQEARTLNMISALEPWTSFHPGNLTFINGEWEGIPERTIQARLTFATSEDRALAVEFLPAVARFLRQDAIAFLLCGSMGGYVAHWTLAQGSKEAGDLGESFQPGGTVADFPVKV